MKYFRLKVAITTLLIALCSAAVTILFYNGQTALGLLISLALPVLYLINRGLLSRLIGMMSSFVSGLEMNDTSMRFEADSHDSELSDMVRSMNRITAIYLTNRRELETRKLYYDRILRVMTHEMRNSIAPIVALSADIETNPDKYGKNETLEAIGIIRNQSEGVKKFLDSYHALTHLPSPEQEEIDAVKFFNKLSITVSQIENLIFPGNGVLTYSIANGVTLFADDKLLTQALINHIKNSLEAVKEKSDRFFDSGISYHPEVRINAFMRGDDTLISIEDNGPGLLPEIANNPFSPFLSTKSNGSGIGMFLSRQIIRMHGGEIKIINRTDKGLAVRINIPCRNARGTMR